MSATYAQIKAQFDSIPTDAEMIERDFSELIAKHEDAGVPREFIICQLSDLLATDIKQTRTEIFSKELGVSDMPDGYKES